jgi:arylsulfatase A
MNYRTPLGMLLAVVATSPVTAADVKRPNIVYIMADDSGIDTYGCYGSDRFKNMTPNIDALAASGARFERCYTTPLCGPTRCLLITGRYGFRTGGMTNASAANPASKDEPSLAAVLKTAGYATGMAGKWRQMSEMPSDWGFDEYVTDRTASGWFWQTEYIKNGEPVRSDKPIYYPDAASDFAVDFFRRHRDEPFFFYLSEHLIHSPILKTPDSKPGATATELYDDNVRYLDKTVGKIVGELEKLGLRENTVILFSADNGTSRVGYLDEHDPKKDVGTIGGRHVNGLKGTLTEGGTRVPLIASWQGTLKPGTVPSDLIDHSDLLPTFAELAGAKLPEGVKFDGRSFAPQLRGETGKPREWIFIQLGNGWFARNDGWKLNQAGALFSMKDAPFVEELVAPDAKDPAAEKARHELQAVLDELNPSGGKVEPPGGKKPKPGRKAKRKANRTAPNDA